MFLLSVYLYTGACSCHFFKIKNIWVPWDVQFSSMLRNMVEMGEFKSTMSLPSGRTTTITTTNGQIKYCQVLCQLLYIYFLFELNPHNSPMSWVSSINLPSWEIKDRYLSNFAKVTQATRNSWDSNLGLPDSKAMLLPTAPLVGKNTDTNIP